MFQKIDNINIEEYQIKKLRNQIALVGQEPVLFSGSIYDNICLGLEDIATLDDVIEACKIANAANFIEKLPMVKNKNLSKM